MKDGIQHDGGSGDFCLSEIRFPGRQLVDVIAGGIPSNTLKRLLLLVNVIFAYPWDRC